MAVAAPGILVLLVVVFPASLEAETHTVRRGESLQAALDAAQPGDVVMLEAGAEFVGNFFLPAKSGQSPIVVRSEHSGRLPATGHRIHPDDGPLLARLRSPNALAALKTKAGAHHWELRYLEFAANAGGYGDIIQLGDGSAAQKTLDRIPHHLTLSHVYVHGDPLRGQKRCIALNAAHVTIRDSYIADCKGVGMDTQAICGWNGPGPYLIENNYLEASGENVMFGGADPKVPNLVPTGITLRRNHITRPFAWRDPIIPMPRSIAATPGMGGTLPAGVYTYRVVARRGVGQGVIGRSTASAEATAVVASHGGVVRVTWKAVPDATEYRVYGRTAGQQKTYWTVTTTSFVDSGATGISEAVPTTPGTRWSVKNLFELKNARNVLLEANTFENHWQEAQAGYSIVLTPRNSSGGCPWCVVEDVRFEHNVVRHVAAGINILGHSLPERPTRQARGIVVRNNLFYDISSAYGGNGVFLLMGAEPRDVVIDHNTISHSGSSLVYAYGGTSEAPRCIQGFRFTNNAARHNAYGINGAFYGYGNDVIQKFFPASTVKGNYLAGGAVSRYPSGNLTAGIFEREFVDLPRGDFRLSSGSQLRGRATDGSDIGADIGLLKARTSNVESGLPTASSPSVPMNVRIVGG
jgi:hypothetical protein